MSDEITPPRNQPSLEVLHRIDQICDRFEAAWEVGDRPRIEDSLGEIEEPYRAALLKALLTVELAARRHLGEQPAPHEYHDRLPGLSAAIEKAFATCVDAPAVPQPIPTASADDWAALLLGLLDTQPGLIGQSDLLDGPRAWAADTTRPLTDSLPQTEADDELLKQLFEVLVNDILKARDSESEEKL